MVLGFFKKAASTPSLVDTPSDAQISRRQGIFGSLDSYSKRRAADRLTTELEAASKAYEAGSRLNDARIDFIKTVSRLTPGSLEKIAREEEMKVEEQFLVQEVRLAEARLKKSMFEERARTEIRRAEAENLEGEMRYRKAYEELHGSPPSEEPTDGEKRKTLENQRDELVSKIKALAAEYLDLTKEGEIDETTEADFTRRNNLLVEELDRVEAELAAL